jgi:hypothetical protein
MLEGATGDKQNKLWKWSWHSGVCCILYRAIFSIHISQKSNFEDERTCIFSESISLLYIEYVFSGFEKKNHYSAGNSMTWRVCIIVQCMEDNKISHSNHGMSHNTISHSIRALPQMPQKNSWCDLYSFPFHSIYLR